MDGTLFSQAKLKIDNKIIVGRSWKKHLRDNSIETLLLQGTYLNSGRIYPIINRLLYSTNWKLVFSGDSMVFTKIDTPITQVTTRDPWQAVLSWLEYIQRRFTNQPHYYYSKSVNYTALGEFNEGVRLQPQLRNMYRSFQSFFPK